MLVVGRLHRSRSQLPSPQSGHSRYAPLGLHIALLKLTMFCTMVVHIAYIVVLLYMYIGWRGGLVVGRRTCDLVVAGSSSGV